MAKQSYAVTIAGGGSTYTPGVVLTLLAKRDVSPSIGLRSMTTMPSVRGQLPRHVPSTSGRMLQR